MKNLIIFLIILLTANVSAQTWTEVGPSHFPVISGGLNGTGRVNQFKFHSSDASIIYAFTRYGGLYISNDTGSNWHVTGTDAIQSSNCASFCVDPSNDQIVYISTCDHLFYQTNCIMYKTIDGGNTWNATDSAGLSTTLACDMIIDPANTQKITIATNDGIWQTLNGAGTWTNVKSGGDFRHMVQIPSTNILIAVTKNEVWRSQDFGATWTQITNVSFSQNGADGMRVCVNNVSPNTVYVISNGGNGVVYKSVDAGMNFTNVYSSLTQCLVCYGPDPLNQGQGDYNLAACCDPQNENHLYVAAQNIWESNDGGISWEMKTGAYSNPHTDHSQLSFSPFDNSKLWVSNDGGMWQRNGIDDSTWIMKSNGMTSLEVWKGACSPNINNLISIGTQDNGELYGDSIGWYNTAGGDFNLRVAFDYTSLNNIYYLKTGTRKSFTPLGTYTSYNSPYAPSSYDYSRIAFNKMNTEMAIMGMDDLWFTNNLSNASPTWSLVYPNNFSIRDIVISTADNSVAYENAHDVSGSKIIRINNLLTTPVVTTFNGPHPNWYYGSVATVKNNIDVVYASFDDRIYRSPDQGASWTDITYNLPSITITKIYVDDYSTNEALYLCSGDFYTSTKIFMKTMNDSSWIDITGNLPKIAYISDFFMYNDSTDESKLYVTTMGRGVWSYNFGGGVNSISTNEVESDLLFKVYPNPANDKIYFENNKSRNFMVSLFSVDGKLIKQMSSSSPILQFDCSAYANGVYFYEIYCDNKATSGKVEIKK